MSTQELIDAIQSGDSVNIQSSFESAMASKIAEKIDVMRQQVAKNMFKESVEELDEDFKHYVKGKRAATRGKQESDNPYEKETKEHEDWNMGFKRQMSKTKPVQEEVEELDEVTYSAKKARAGEDIGKPGKEFEKIAADAAERYGSEERGKKVAGAILAKLRKK